jgi:hypothetical protein
VSIGASSRQPHPQLQDRGPFLRRFIPVILLSALALAGCTQSGDTTRSPAPDKAAVETSTPTPTPTPELMTNEEAGEYFLNAVCPPNALLPPLTEAENKLYAANGGDLTELKAIATDLRDRMQEAALELTDPMVIWPNAAADSAALIADNYYTEISGYNAMIGAETFEDLTQIVWPEQPAGGDAAGPKIRSVLGVDVDPVASCKGHETP